MNKDEFILDYVWRIEFDILLFFLGVLLLVGMFKELGVLVYFLKLYNYLLILVVNYVVGLVFVLFDNVFLIVVLFKFGIDMLLFEWLMLIYSVGVGGLLLVIGFVVGVVVMSKVEVFMFGSYLKFFGYLLVVYIVGFVGVVMLG